VNIKSIQILLTESEIHSAAISSAMDLMAMFSVNVIFERKNQKEPLADLLEDFFNFELGGFSGVWLAEMILEKALIGEKKHGFGQEIAHMFVLGEKILVTLPDWRADYFLEDVYINKFDFIKNLKIYIKLLKIMIKIFDQRVKINR
jgi:hypothetical protein